MLNKKKRIQDRSLLDTYHNKPCEICGTSQGVVGHHIKTKKSGGPDVPNNLIALCPNHHSEIHMIGNRSFMTKYPKFVFSLKSRGWQIDGEKFFNLNF